MISCGLSALSLLACWRISEVWEGVRVAGDLGVCVCLNLIAGTEWRGDYVNGKVRGKRKVLDKIEGERMQRQICRQQREEQSVSIAPCLNFFGTGSWCFMSLFASSLFSFPSFPKAVRSWSTGFLLCPPRARREFHSLSPCTCSTKNWWPFRHPRARALWSCSVTLPLTTTKICLCRDHWEVPIPQPGRVLSPGTQNAAVRNNSVCAGWSGGMGPTHGRGGSGALALLGSLASCPSVLFWVHLHICGSGVSQSNSTETTQFAHNFSTPN